MAHHNLFSAAEEVGDFRHVRQHLVIIGAGASRAAFPHGERNGHRLPLMADFAEIVPVGPILEESGVDWRGKNFEEVYSLISENPKHGVLQTQIERAVYDYFSKLRLPDTPTLYDTLILSLRQKDVIATLGPIPYPGMPAKC